MLLLAAGIGSLQVVLERGERLDWFSSPMINVLTVVSVVSLIAFVFWELSQEHPVVDLRVFKHRSLAFGTVSPLFLVSRSILDFHFSGLCAATAWVFRHPNGL